MYGFDLIEIIAFLRQFGLALTGAASLWGLVFVYYKHTGRQAHSRHVVLDWISWKMLIPFYVGLLATFGGWLLYESMLPLYAHEGIIVVPTVVERMMASAITSPVYVLWFILNALAGFFILLKGEGSLSRLKIFYVINFLFVFFLISVPAWTGELSFAQLFHIGHGFHSIFTFGTVVVLDFLFLLSFSSTLLKEHIYPLFPLISKVIWVGLGFDFLSVSLVFDEAIRLIPKFFFMQTIVGILIVNGILLSGPITRKLIESISIGGKSISPKWRTVADISGTISVASWFSITFTDFFEDITLSYSQLLLCYAGLIILLLIGHKIWDITKPFSREVVTIEE